MSQRAAPAKDIANAWQITPREIAEIYEGGYRDVEVRQDGTIRRIQDGEPVDDQSVRTLKTERTWY